MTVALVLSLGTSAATANRSFEFTTAEIRDISRAITFESAGMVVICESILAKRLHQTVAKVSGSLLGTVRSATLANCMEGERRIDVRFLISTWHIQYQSFRGILPEITAVLIKIMGMAVLFAFGVFNCLYTGNVGYELPVVAGRITRLVILSGQILTATTQELTSILCPSEIRVTGVFTPEPALTARLI